MGRQISQRIEVLLKKASVDPAFRAAFLEHRGEAAREIGLSLDPAEAALLRAVPRSSLRRSSTAPACRTNIAGHFSARRRLPCWRRWGSWPAGPGAAEPGTDTGAAHVGGVRPDARPGLPRGTADCRQKPKTIEQRVIGVIAKQLKVEELRITTQNKEAVGQVSLVDDLEATPAGLAQLRKALEKEFGLKIPPAAFKKLHTAGETVDYVKKAVEKRRAGRPRQAGRRGEAAGRRPRPPVPPVAPAACARLRLPAPTISMRALLKGDCHESV